MSDINSRGKERPWATYKELNQYLAVAYDEINCKKAERLRNCAEWLEFKMEDNRMRLHKANFCRVRLCPVCQWRRSLKTFAQMRKVIAAIHNDYSFLHLVLTVPNCSADKLSETLDKMFYAFNKMTKYAKFYRVVKGYYRGMEVTHNIKENTFHPHFHCILAVNKSYFTSRDYIKQSDWLALWRKAMKDNSISQVHIEKFKYNVERGIAECAKYTCKVSDYVIFDDWDLTVKTVRTLDSALNKRRFIGLGGIIKEMHKQLNLDDIEDGSLTHVEVDEDALADEDVQIIRYIWSTGYNQYILEEMSDENE